MAFSDIEASAAGGSKVELYTLTVGSEAFFVHNSVEAAISYGGYDYEPLEIKRGSITSKASEEVRVTLPSDHDFPVMFLNMSPSSLCYLAIHAYHRSLPSDVQMVFTGEIRNVMFTNDMSSADLMVIPSASAYSKSITDRTFQNTCNHVLFSTGCTILKSSYKFTGNVSAVSGRTITVPGLSASKGTGWATGGYVALGVEDHRLIIDQTGDVLTLSLPFYSTVLAESVDVFAGCDRTIETCLSKFSNTDNFDGCPYLAGNPFEGL